MIPNMNAIFVNVLEVKGLKHVEGNPFNLQMKLTKDETEPTSGDLKDIGNCIYDSDVTWKFQYSNARATALCISLNYKQSNIANLTLPLKWFQVNTVVTYEFPFKIAPGIINRTQLMITLRIHLSENHQAAFDAPNGKIYIVPGWKVTSKFVDPETAPKHKQSIQQVPVQQAPPPPQSYYNPPPPPPPQTPQGLPPVTQISPNQFIQPPIPYDDYSSDSDSDSDFENVVPMYYPEKSYSFQMFSPYVQHYAPVQPNQVYIVQHQHQTYQYTTPTQYAPQPPPNYGYQQYAPPQSPVQPPPQNTQQNPPPKPAPTIESKPPSHPEHVNIPPPMTSNYVEPKQQRPLVSKPSQISQHIQKAQRVENQKEDISLGVPTVDAPDDLPISNVSNELSDKDLKPLVVGSGESPKKSKQVDESSNDVLVKEKETEGSFLPQYPTE
ncbi:hypothetical protein GPJ56_004152 [Histomonas meleagridis]|uniref:uncharacterized protein n=1 Tax=Histomonas meleagridis TaxID=135588 RepID=UPI003559F3DA|nr:hypothetical protein GPJ56_004152 [Histomonas meleagridis]KAH0801493.1 hypothetical protein GO595_005745 [Histomonas meleagridis]